jgi:hypothetical protein
VYRNGGLDYHGKYRARAKEVAQSTEERSFLEIMVVLLSEFLGWNHQLDSNKLESFPLKSGYYLRNLAQERKERHPS